jgi:hypothetical protein
VVVPLLGGTTTVVDLAEGGGSVTQADSIAARINRLDTTFIFVSLAVDFEEPIVGASRSRPIWA